MKYVKAVSCNYLWFARCTTRVHIGSAAEYANDVKLQRYETAPTDRRDNTYK